MFRMYLLQTWYNLSDEALEGAIYDSYAMRKFMHLDFLEESVPDATTLCKFRKIIVENGRANMGASPYNPIMFEREARVLELLMSEGYFL